MPLYVYQCPTCGQRKQDMNTVENRHSGPKCTRFPCAETMVLQISPVAGIVKNPAVPRRHK